MGFMMFNTTQVMQAPELYLKVLIIWRVTVHIDMIVNGSNDDMDVDCWTLLAVFRVAQVLSTFEMDITSKDCTGPILIPGTTRRKSLLKQND